MQKTNQPHDKLFKSAFSRKDIALDYISQFLPKALVERLDLEQLTIEKDSYVTDDLDEYFSDIVYTCPYDSGAKVIKITLLLEHKSQQTKDAPFQLLRYMLEIWVGQIKNKEQLTPVVPIIFYHGKKAWKNRQFADFFEGVDDLLKPYLPNFEYLLTDLSKWSDEALLALNMGFLVNTFLLFKHQAEKSFLKNNIATIFVHTEHKTIDERNFIRTLLVYLLETSDFRDREFEEVKQNIPSPLNKLAMSTYDMILEQGVKKGKLEGKIEGKIEGKLEGKLEGKIEGKIETLKENIIKLSKFGLKKEQIVDALVVTIEQVENALASVKKKKSK